MTSTPVIVQIPRMTPQVWANSDGAGAAKTIYTAGTNGSKIVAINATSSDTSNRVFQLYQVRGATSYLLGSATVTTLAGEDGATATQNLLALMTGLPKDQNGNPFIYLEFGDTLQALNVTQITAAKNVWTSTIGGDF